jgi:16S rRNA (guanine527-N7)-methyltransferase
MNESESFEIYLRELIAWNKKFNLTSLTDPEAIRQKHFTDSLFLLQAVPLSGQMVVDIGAGAGFPGLPLKLVCPEIKLTLVEATRKKADFLAHLIKILGLKEARVVWARAEEFALNNREAFDIAVARAVAELRVLAELCLPLVRVGGFFVAYKKAGVAAEVEAARPAIKELGGQLREVKKFPQRSLVIIDKVAATPARYPRRAGIAKKKPL